MVKHKKIYQKKETGYKFRKLKQEREKRKLKNNKISLPPPYESFLKNKYDKYNIKQNPEILLNYIKNLISSLIKIIEKYNPIDILSHLSRKYLIANPELYNESTSERRENIIEYLLSIILAIENPISKTIGDEMDIVEELLNKIIDNTLYYYITESFHSELLNEERSLRFHLINSYISIRGDTYGRFYLEMAREIFNPINEELKKEINVKIEDINNCIKDIENQINDNIKNPKNPLILLIKQQQQGIINDNQGITELSNLLKTKEDFDNLLRDYSIFRIYPRSNTDNIIYEIFSTTYGENKSFLEDKGQIKGWPLNDSIIEYKSILRDQNRYFAFNPHILARGYVNNIEKNLSKKTIQKLNKSKSKYLEEKSIEYFKLIFPDDTVYSNLYYYTSENGQKKRNECDGLILYGNNILLIESKSSKIEKSARRGSITQFKRSMKKIIHKAYEQCLRTKLFIKNNEIANFYDEKGNLILSIENKTIENFYLINVTLELLAPISTQLHLLRNFNLIKGEDWIWSVYINDLKIIKELNESPCEFLLYLQRRLELNDKAKIFSYDEMDFYMFFLESGLIFEKNLEEFDRIILPGITEDLDNYYHYKFGYRSKSPKPKFNIAKDYWKLIRYFEKNRRTGFSEIAITLLKMNSDRVLQIITEVKKRSNKRNGYSHAFLYYSDLDLGINISLRPINIDFNIEGEFVYINARKYKQKVGRVISLAGTFDQNDEIHWEYMIIDYPWNFNEDLEKIVKEMGLSDISNIKFSN